MCASEVSLLVAEAPPAQVPTSDDHYSCKCNVDRQITQQAQGAMVKMQGAKVRRQGAKPGPASCSASRDAATTCNYNYNHSCPDRSNAARCSNQFNWH